MEDTSKSYLNFFSDEEFESIAWELTKHNPVCYDTFAMVVKRMLVGYIGRICNGYCYLRDSHLQEDIFQDIYIKLQKTCITHFFLRNGEINYDPLGFKNWVFTVAKNYIIDFAKKRGRIQFNEAELDKYENTPDSSDILVSDDALCRLSDAFCTVINSNLGIHKVLTWLAVMITVCYRNQDKIDANRTVEEECTNLTLDQMLDLILSRADKITWLSIGDGQIENLRSRLDEIGKSRVRLGDMKYGDFYMKAGSIKSISDWTNRIKEYLEKR